MELYDCPTAEPGQWIELILLAPLPARGPDQRARLGLGPRQYRAELRTVHRAALMAAKPTATTEWLPPAWTRPGPWQVRSHRLVPSTLRAAFVAAFVGASARLTIQGDELPERDPVWRSASDAARQHRRQTWTQRLARNELSPQARVEVRLTARTARLLPGGGRLRTL